MKAVLGFLAVAVIVAGIAVALPKQPDTGCGTPTPTTPTTVESAR